MKNCLFSSYITISPSISLSLSIYIYYHAWIPFKFSGEEWQAKYDKTLPVSKRAGMILFITILIVKGFDFCFIQSSNLSFRTRILYRYSHVLKQQTLKQTNSFSFPPIYLTLSYYKAHQYT